MQFLVARRLHAPRLAKVLSSIVLLSLLRLMALFSFFFANLIVGGKFTLSLRFSCFALCERRKASEATKVINNSKLISMVETFSLFSVVIAFGLSKNF
jgi:hypothetical protein